MNSNKKIKVALITDFVPSYRWSYLGKLSSYNDIDFIVCHSDKHLNEASKTEQLKSEILFNQKYLRIVEIKFLNKKIKLQNIFPILKIEKPEVVILNPALYLISLIFLVLIKHKYNIKIIWETHGYDRNAIDKKSTLYRIKNKVIRLYLAKKIDAFLFYSEDGRKYYLENGFTPDNMFVFNNTLDTERLLSISDNISSMEIDQFKEKIKITDEKILCFIGRLYKEKKLEDLLLAYAQLQKNYSIALVIIGDGERREKIKQMTDKLDLRKVYFMGDLRDDKQIGIILKASYLMVNPGNVGLSIIHGMTFGLPFICENLDTHGPEIFYLHHGNNGYISQPTPQSLAKACSVLLLDPLLHANMSRNAVLTIKNEANVGHMIDQIISAIRYVLKL